MENIKEESFKPTLKQPSGDLAKGYEKTFSKAMSQDRVKLTETDGLLNEREQSLKKKIFSLAKMEALVFADPKLAVVYDEMSENGEEKYGYHYNETIMNMLFNDYVLNSPRYLEKYKMAQPLKKKRRDKSGINQLKKAGDVSMHKKPVNPIKTTPAVAGIGEEVTNETTGAGGGGAGAFAPALGFKNPVDETTTSASSGAYAGPAAWGSGDLMKTGSKSKIMRKPIWQGGTIIQESNYLTDPSAFADYIDFLNEEFEINSSNDAVSAVGVPIAAARTKPDIAQQNNVKPYTNPSVNDKIIDKTAAFSSDTVKNWDKPDTDLELHTVNSGTMDEPQEIEEKATSPAQQRLFGMAHAVQKGELSPNKVGGAVKKIAKTVSPQDVTDFASTSHDEMDETIQSIIDDKPDSVAKGTPTGTVTTGNVPVGLVDMKEEVDLLNEINNELNAYSIHHNKLKQMSEDRKPSSLVMKDRLGSENQTNFKKDLQHSGTKEIIDVEKELQYKDQQTEADPEKLGAAIEKNEIKTTKGEAFKNVGNSTNDKGDEVPKRNMTTAEQDEVNLYRKGMHSLVYDNKPDQRFEDRMKADMGDAVYEIREKQMADFGKQPMYNKEAQPTEPTKAVRTEFDKEKSGWNDPKGLSEAMISGRYRNALDKSHIIDFVLNEVKFLKQTSEDKMETLFPLDFTGLGNTLNSKTHNYKVSVNEGVVNILDENKFYTDGTQVYAIKNPKVNLSEAKKTSPPPPALTEEMNKMKHLLGYKGTDFVSTNNVKKNRGF